MRALAQHMGKQRDSEVLIPGSQALLPPPGASEVDVKAWQVQHSYQRHIVLCFCTSLNTLSSCQLHKLLESTECDMIRAAQRRINRELTLVVSERTRQDAGLPTGPKTTQTYF